MAKKWDESCKSCQAVRGIIRLTPAPRILETKYWVIEHAGSVSLRGWLVVTLKRHATAIHDLTEEEMVEFGKVARVASQALHAILKTEKEYIIKFAEGVGFPHIHIHIIARLPKWPKRLRGPRVMKAMGEDVKGKLTAEEVTPLALEIREYLLKNVPGEMVVK
jgi:diadenosine tetraphosphate (Ap4A) HIT family hydrolase